MELFINNIKEAIQCKYSIIDVTGIQRCHCVPARAGVVVFKSVPLGSLKEVLPYLSRRAQENRAVLKGARRERLLLFREIKDRITGRASGRAKS